MGTEYYQATDARQRRSLLWRLIVPIMAFVGGAIGMAWLLVNWSAAASLLGVAPKPAPPPARPVQLQVEPEIVPAPLAETGDGVTGETQRLVIDPEISRRVLLLEQRVGAIDTQARVAVGNADRAEGLLVAFAARRALDRGVSLGYIEGLLRRRFGATQPQAVGTIITASRNPVTLQELQDGLMEVGPALSGGGPDQSWWDALQSEFRDLVTIRKSGTPSPMPKERLTRASRRLEAGQVEVALAEVLRMPGRENAQDWIFAARRYVAARRALDAIETAALLEPRVQRRPVNPAPAAPLSQ
jgi:hypothetical protein